MKLLSFKVRNFLRIEAAEITPDGALVEISGANEAGKSSLLRAFVCALAGKDAIPADPVRHGADKAEIDLTFDELRLRLVILPDREAKLLVTDAKGFRAGAPQRLLDGLYSKLIDPFAFSRLSPKQQRETVAEMAGLSKMLDELARADESDRNLRRDVNRDLKQAEARLAAMPEVAAVDPVDVSATLAELRGAREYNDGLAAERARREANIVQAERLRADAHEKRQKAQQLFDEAQRIVDEAKVMENGAANLESATRSLAPVGEYVAIWQIEERLERAEAINAQARAYAEREALAKDVADFAADSQKFSDLLTQREAERRAVIEKADLPVDGLGFGEDCLTYNGVRFDQASTAVTTRVCTAIAMKMSPKIRVLLVKDWSLLDSKNRAIVVEMAEANGFLVLAEVVDESGEVGVYIEDGRVSAVNGVPVEPTAEVLV